MQSFISGLLLLFFPAITIAACPQLNVNFNTSATDICGPGATVISFTNTSTGTANATADYEWFMNGTQFSSTTGLTTPTGYTLSSVGTYTFMVIGTDNSVPCADTATIVVRIYPQPVSSFTFSPASQCAGNAVAFNNNASGTFGSTSFLWNFGDGQTSTAVNPNHVYAAGGTYTATLTVTNGPGCSATSSQSITIQPAPVVSIMGDDGDGNTTNCLLPIDTMTQQTVTFSNFTTGAVSYSWNFGDGSPVFNTTSTAPFTHQYTSYGTYTVTMTATHANGCTTTGTLTVVFEKYVSTSFSVPILQMSGCAPHTIQPVNGSVNANTYVWNFGDGTPAITTTNFAPPSHSYNANGSYTVTLTASNSCNTSVATVSPIVVVAKPVPQFATSLPGNLGCSPQTVTFTNSSQFVAPANNYQWNFGNGNTATNQVTPGPQTYMQGTYTVQLIAGNGCGTDTMMQVITIDTIPTADITVTPVEGCTPLTVNTTNQSTGQSLSYAWYIDGAFSYNTQQIPAQTFTAPVGNNTATHTIRLVVSNHCGTDDSLVPVIVHPAVSATITPLNPVICEGQSVTFNQTTRGDSLTYFWDFGNGTTSTLAGPHTVSYTTAGTYQVTYIANGYCGTDTVTTNVTVNPIPLITFTADADTICEGATVTFTNLSTAGSSVSWSFGTGALPASSTLFTPPAVTYPAPGNYQVILSGALAGCPSADTLFIQVDPKPTVAFTALPAQGCSPLEVTFNNTSGSAAGETFAWNFGNGSTSILQNPPSQTYFAVGADSLYQVTLNVVNNFGCEDSLTQQITVFSNPVAGFSPLIDTICATYNLAFTNLSTGATSYSWNFGDGTPVVSNVHPTHSFTTAGTYTVQLIAMNAAGCSDTITGIVVADSIPTAQFANTIECVGGTTSFTDQSLNAVSWNWNFGDGSPQSTAQNPTHQYAGAGSYTVQLTVTNSAGCAHSVNQTVVVNTVPVAGFNHSATCIGQPTLFTDLTTGVPAGWEWDFGDGSALSTIQNPSYTYSDTGTYSVMLVASGGTGCTDTITHTITVHPKPVSAFTFAEVCTGDSTLFVSTSTGTPDTYLWVFGDGTTDNTNDPAPAHIYATTGTYQVSLIAGYSATGCADTATIPVDAFPRTIPAFSTNTPCLGAAVIFTDQTSASPTSWSWDFGDGNTSSQTSPSHTYLSPATFQVTLVTTNSFGCTDSLTQSVTVNPLPTASFIADTVCQGVSTTFTDQSTGAVSWNWNFGDGTGTSTTASPGYTFATSGTFQVTQIVTNTFGCTDTLTVPVVVHANPVAAFVTDSACNQLPTLFTELPGGGVSWSWYPGDGSGPFTQQQLSHIYPADGTYNAGLLVTNIFGCTDSVNQQVIVLPRPQAGFISSTVCASQPVQFTDTSTGSPTLWSWDFGDGSALSTVQNPQHNYTTGGTYLTTLIAGNPSGCSDTVTIQVEVNSVPVPAFIADTVCFGNITHFTDQSTDTDIIVNWYWDFGDGNNSPAQHPTYIYQAPGTYFVNLIVTNSHGCDSAITIPVIVNPQPVAAYHVDTVCVGTPTTFTDLSSGSPVSWNWDFGDGNTSTNGPVVTHTYASAGNYISVLQVSGGANCSDQTFQIVTVSNVVQASIGAPAGICDGTPVNFADASIVNSGTISAWNWNFGDGNTSTTQNPQHNYASAGTHTVTLTVTSSGGCTSTDSLLFTVYPLPQADFNSQNVCAQQAGSFTDLSTGNPVSWLWDFGDGSSSPIQHPQHTYSTAGVMNVKLVVTNQQGCQDSIMKPVVVYPKPVALFTADTACWGNPTTFVNQSNAGTGVITNSIWDFGDGITLTGLHQQHTFQVRNDSFIVTLVVLTNHGCRDTISQLVTTHPLPEISFSPASASGCQPFTTSMSDLTTVVGGQIVNWLWDFGDGNFGFGQNPLHTYANAGDYFVSLTLTDDKGCEYEEALLYPVKVYPKPSAGFSMSPDNEISIFLPEIQFNDMSSGATYYNWNFGDDLLSSASNPMHHYSDTGSYMVTQIVMNSYGCVDSVSHPVRVKGEFTMFFPSAFTPNGDTKNDFYNGQGTGLTAYRMQIFDRWGVKIFETTSLSSGWDGTYRGETVQQDVYIYRAIVKDIFGEEHSYEGHVTLVR